MSLCYYVDQGYVYAWHGNRPTGWYIAPDHSVTPAEPLTRRGFLYPSGGGYTGYYIADGHIFGPDGYTHCYFDKQYIYGPAGNLPFEEGDEG